LSPARWLTSRNGGRSRAIPRAAAWAAASRSPCIARNLSSAAVAFNHVGRIDPTTHENVVIAELPKGAKSIAFSADGRLFVGLVILKSGLYEVDPEGTRSPADNSLYALRNSEGDAASPALDKIDLDRGGVTRFSEPSIKSVDNFAIGPTGRFFVTGFDIPALVVVEPDGSNGPRIEIGVR
jgi:hypothetical protein